MTGGTRIVAIDAASANSAPGDEAATMVADGTRADEAHWDDDAQDYPPPPRRWPARIAAGLACIAVAAWTWLFALANTDEIAAGGTPAQWVGWIRDWSVPVLLIGVSWLIAMRNSRREALRFGETARLLGDESARLESRLATVNRELSLAREFIAAQSRDLDALGRTASERIGEHADRLASLISDNGTRIDAIGSVSEAALDNMEKLRFQLPVIASSAKDVTNNIGAAGRTAQIQLEEMVQGFNRLNQFGQASERQVKVLRDLVDDTLAGFAHQSEQLEAITQNRFAALNERSNEFRAQLDAHEIEILAAIRSRAKALGEELDGVRGQLDSSEAESLTSLRARLGAVRDESAAIARSLRDSEGSALDAWRRSIGQLEEDLSAAVAKVEAIDEAAMASARKRLAELAAEAEQVDARMAERDRIFTEEIEQRQAELAKRQADFNQRMSEQMAMLDSEIAERRALQEQQSLSLVQHSETIAEQLADFSSRMEAVAAQGSEAEAAIAKALDTLAHKLVASREALSGTDAAILGLTDGSVRLLELIRAAVTHSEEDLPNAIGTAEARLATLAEQAGSLRDVVKAAEMHGSELAGLVSASNEGLEQGIARSAKLDQGMAAQLASIDALGLALDKVRAESTMLAEQTQGELAAAIAQLDGAARAAVTGIGELSAAEIAGIAARIGDESGAAIEKAMRAKAAEVAGQLEQAAAHATGVSREAALQLRDQLGKVSELAGNLERRVAHARERAQEQVDNDFARRVALITESLNSNAIDIARVMDTDVTDTAWAAYLKGDRGIFTRRAVRLMETAEAKAVTQLYETERDFRDHVSRYIHDFEAMLRQLLSTRDGHALGVTLLSSDMGKLYVALAQAIERLRN
ncbi:ATPase [Novosphingobium sp.]|uniref:ATPase n=1 Tax=Novosphingobium sp. TaxID=1874826 RepID=UPI0035AF2E03